MEYMDFGPDGVPGTSDDEWLPAVEGNFGSTNDTFLGVEAWNGDMTLGDWGVNTANHTVWAVVNHNSDFAVVPEPSTLVLLGAAAVALAGGAGGGELSTVSEELKRWRLLMKRQTTNHAN